MKLVKKLRSARGESLVEALAAILIFTFASIILLSMISAAGRINTTARQADDALQAELYVAEAQDASQGEEGTITFSVTVDGATRNKNTDVLFYCAEPGKLYTFSFAE